MSFKKTLVIYFMYIIFNLINANDLLFDGNIIKIIGEELLNEKYQKIQSDCISDLIYMIESFPKTWAIQFLDSAGKIPSGISAGNMHSFGQFDMCIGINHINSSIEKNIQGKYCIAKIPIDSIPGSRLLRNDIEKFFNHNSIVSGTPGGDVDFFNALTFNIGICIPKICNGKDIQNLLHNTFPSINISDNECSTSESLPITAADWFAISLLIIMGLLLLTSTTYDVFTQYMKKEPHKHHNILVAFSLKTNTERLLRINTNKSSLKCIHGIRVLSMFWIILGHRYLATLTNPTWSFTDIIKWIDQYSSMIILGATVSVDTFFLLSGLLLSYVFFKQIEKEKSFNIIMFYVHRHLRLTPSLLAIILFQATIYKHLTYGSIYNNWIKQSIENCQIYWWPTFLYIQNYVHSTHMCIGQSWYLAVDMQLYYLSPLILYPLYKSKKYGLINLTIWIFAFLTTLLTIVYMNNWPAATIPFAQGFEIKISEYYITTHMRAVPWLLGIAMGYAIYNSTKRQIHINKVLVMFLWLICFTIMGAVVFGLLPLQDPTHIPNKLEDGTFDSFHRIAWSLAVSWIIFACIHGYGGPIDWILSLDIWQILGRLTYSMYLVHLSIQFWQASMLRVVSNFSHVRMVYNFCGDIIFTIIISYCIKMMFESPILALEKNIVHRYKAKQSENPDQMTSTI